MFNPEIKRTQSGVPVISKLEIDGIGEEIIRDFCPIALKEPQAINIDLLAQDYMKMEQDFQYLSHNGIYLGMTIFNDTKKVPVYNPIKRRAEYIHARANTIIIDNSLLEPNQNNRYRFTMGHEVAHGFLHKEYFCCDPNQYTLSMVHAEAMIQCRVDMSKHKEPTDGKSSDKQWMEWQANTLSSAILMPKPAVFIVVDNLHQRNYKYQRFLYEAIDKLSSVFEVSHKAAESRLRMLGVLEQDIQINMQFLPLIRICV